MRLYEYEVKDLLARAGMNTPRRVPVGSRFDAVAAAETLGGPVAVKAQTLIKARGKAGLIRFASTAAEVEEAADNILGREHHGEKIETLLIEEKLGLEKEMYLGLVVDYAAGRPVLLASPSGGVEIEEIAARDPHLVLKQSITPSRGLTGEQARIAAGFLAGDGGSPELIEELAKAALTLYDLFVQRDLEMLEVNPLVLTCPGRVTALDGAAVVDGDALFRQPDLVKPRNQSLADFERERNFAARGWTYLKFPGNIGILSSGAGHYHVHIGPDAYVGWPAGQFSGYRPDGPPGDLRRLSNLFGRPGHQNGPGQYLCRFESLRPPGRGHQGFFKQIQTRIQPGGPYGRQPGRRGLSNIEGNRDTGHPEPGKGRGKSNSSHGGSPMSILAFRHSKVLIQGITGRAARHHTENMLAYGTAIVAGTRPGAGGQKVAGVPVYDSVEEACQKHQPDAAILFIPAKAVKASALEALDAGIKLLVIVTEHVPLHDAMIIMEEKQKREAVIIGPNTPGMISPGEKAVLGFVPTRYFTPGPMGVASRSGTLTYELVSRLSAAGLGQSTCIGVGGDRLVGLRFAEALERFEEDEATRAVLLVGEIGGSMEEEAAELIKSGRIKKPVIAYLAGQTAPEGTKLGHAGAIVAAGRGAMKTKLKALAESGVKVARQPAEAIILADKVLR